MSEPWLILETSGRGGTVALAVGGVVRHAAALDPGRRHNRDLAPAAQQLLADAGLTPRELTGVIVGLGPGSYTGLRVGLISAKALAYAVGCRLVGVPTFAALAEALPSNTGLVDVISDGLQGLVYVQRYRRGETCVAVNGLHILSASEWAAELTPEVSVTGPGLEVHGVIVPDGIRRTAPELWVPSADALYQVGLRLPAMSCEEWLTLEPLYLRPSSAEEQAAKQPVKQ